LKDRFKVWRGYKFDKVIFRITLFILILCLSAVVVINGSSPKYYFKCDSPLNCDLSEFKQTFCNEPLSWLEKIKYPDFEEWLSQSNLCFMEFAPNGFEFGVQTGFLQGSEVVISVFIVFLAFLLNHFVYNKNFKFEEV